MSGPEVLVSYASTGATIEPTAQFRWLVLGTTTTEPPLLQQAFHVRETGEVSWRTVPTEFATIEQYFDARKERRF